MQCALCAVDLRPVAAGLPRAVCPACSGTLLTSDDAAAWDEAWPAPDAPADAPAEVWELAQELDPAKRCPVDGRIMRKYAVGNDLDFRLDRCATCHAVWLDPGEWQALGRAGLHHDIWRIVDDTWQEAVRVAEADALHEELLERRFGADDLARLRDVRAWLDDHLRRSAMLAFLGARR